MRQRQPSSAWQGCAKRGARRGESGEMSGKPSALRRAASSAGRNFTSAKITPLQHKPHSRQSSSAALLVEVTSFAFNLFNSVIVLNYLNECTPFLPLRHPGFSCKVLIKFLNPQFYERTAQ